MNKLELLQKIKALADFGVSGEKENAQKLLDKLMRKYKIKEEEISEETINIYPIKWRGFKGRQLAVQVFFSIIEDLETRKFYTFKNRQAGEIHCTPAEFLEWQAKFKFYQYHLNKDLDVFYGAFVHRNKIFGKCTKADDSYKLTAEDIQMLSLADRLQKHNYALQIEHKQI